MEWIRLRQSEPHLGLTPSDIETLVNLYPLLGEEWYEGCGHRQGKINEFNIQRDLVTNEEFIVFLNHFGNQQKNGVWWYWAESPYRLIEKRDDNFSVKPGAEKYPVTGVSLSGARAYAKWKDARLPTEDEWEYAARAGSDSLYPWGDDVPENQCNHWDLTEKKYLEAMIVLNDGRGPTPVDTFAGNKWGLRDMIGNIWEWCEAPGESPEYGVLRGGSWNDIVPIVFLPSFRHKCPVTYRLTYTFGFRLAK